MKTEAKRIDENELADIIEKFEVLASRVIATKNGAARVFAEHAQLVVVTQSREIARLRYEFQTLCEQVRLEAMTSGGDQSED